MANATVALPPGAVPAVPADLSGGPRSGNVVRWAAGINAALRGNISATLKVTLAPGATNSVFSDSRIGPFSYIGLAPLTANAALQAQSGNLYIVPSQGNATIYHAGFPYTDQTFLACIIGS